MRVALLVTDLERGGTPLRIARLARGLKECGVEVSVGCLAPPGPVSKSLDKSGIRTFACGACGAWDFAAIPRLARHLRLFDPDIIHASLTHANIAARLVGDWLGIPVVTSTATIEVERRWHRTIERLTAHLDAGHIVNSRALAAHVADAFQVALEHVYVTPPLIELPGPRAPRDEARRRFGLPEGSFVALWAGRFDPVKRVELALGAVELINDARVHLLLAGDGPTRRGIEDRASQGACREQIHFAGWLDDLTEAFSAADVLLFPSLTEGMPNTVLQAMAFGLPVVCSDIPATRELAGEYGRLRLVAGDDARNFASALRELASDDAECARMARESALWARAHLDLRETFRAHIEVYESVLSRR